MSDLDISVGKILAGDDDVKLEKEQDAMDGAKSFAKKPTNKIPEPSLVFLLVLKKFSFWEENSALGYNFEVFLIFPNFLRS